MLRRSSITLFVAGLGLAAFLLARSGPPRDEGLVVHVTVRDEAGEPVREAQVERTFDPGWHVVDAAGRYRLTKVVLRAAEAPSPEALRVAVGVRAPFYSARPGFPPVVERRADGSWQMAFTLQRHGVLRVRIEDTTLGRVKAYVRPDEPLHRLEAMDEGNVARPGRPAAFRVYPGMDEVVVTLVGEADAQGIVAVATRTYVVKPPEPGLVTEMRLVPGPVAPIVGTMVVPGDPAPPTKRGRVAVTGLEPGGGRVAYEGVAVDDEGLFVVPRVGEGRYELRAELDFYGPSEPVIVEGGNLVDVKAGPPRPWAALRHPGFDAGARAFVFHLWPVVDGAPGPVAAAAPGAVRGEDRSVVPLPGVGAWEINEELPGTRDDPPRVLRARFEARAAGPVEADLAVGTRPHGTVVVSADEAAWEGARGATAIVARQRRSLMPKLAERATFPNVAAGPTLVEVTWTDPEAAVFRAAVDVPADGEVQVVARHQRAGRLHLRPEGPATGAELAAVLVPYAETPIRATRVYCRCAWDGAARVWTTEERFAPGRYRATLQWTGGREAEDVAFTIEAGKTTVVAVAGP